MNKPGQKIAMISSTSVDLPEHRPEVRDACLREGYFPDMMESLPARDADAIKVSLEMVDRADVYIGIYAWRYGHKPEGHDISITEMEFNRAIERKIPILVFVIHKDHALTIEMVETDKDAQQKLASLKERASTGRGRREFKSPEDLRGEVIHALSDLNQREQESSGETVAPSFHPPNIIPKSPEPYIAHPYSLLQTKDVVGRQIELNLLTDWVTTNKLVPADTRIFNLVAIGGMGKSALTWKWFNDIAPNELPKLAGRMWWSFYESDAHWENFIIRALAYVSGQSEKEVREMKSPDREEQLWQILDQKPFLLVLDGLERILLAYARMDAAQMLDEDLDEKTANRVAKAFGLPASAAADFFIGKQTLRLTADHRAGHFLRRLARVRNSRLLITTRLYPINLQSETGDPLPGCAAQFLTGLTDSDALNLWREFKVTGSDDQLLPLFRSFGNYPLLIRALAGEVARYRGGPRDFDKWRADNPNFDPTRLLLKNAKSHVLEYALRGLPEEHRKVLQTIAAFRMPATWETLRALLVDSGKPAPRRGSKSTASKPCASDHAFDLILTELEDRGLVGWDKKANRYDLHPVVRGVVWGGASKADRINTFANLRAYYAVLPFVDQNQVRVFDELSNSIELYYALVGLERFDEAFVVFRSRFEIAAVYRFSHSRTCAELLQLLFPDGLNRLPRLSQWSAQVAVINALAQCFHFSGEPRKSGPLYAMALEILRTEGDDINLAVLFYNSSWTLRPSGSLHKSQTCAQHALALSRTNGDFGRDAIATQEIGITCEVRGAFEDAAIALMRSTAMFKKAGEKTFEGIGYASLGQLALRLGDAREAGTLAKSGWELAESDLSEKDAICAGRIVGEAALHEGDLSVSDEWFTRVLTRSRAINFVEEELPILTTMAELHRRRGNFAIARELLDQIWDPAEHGPYPLFHADALNVLAQIERDEGNTKAAIAAATKAYTLAWCDGPPYAYHYGLTNARKHLEKLGAPEPQLPPFDESKFEPMPDVELNPRDEFWVDPDKLDSLS